MNAIVLVGLSGTGKSSVGRRVAARLDLPFVDTDALIEAGAGKAVHRIFAEEGEAQFRALESAAVAEAVRLGRCVIATGGGAVLCARTREVLAAGNLVVWLDAAPAVLAARLRGHVTTPDERPLLRGDDLEGRLSAMLAARGPLYEECAALRIDTSALDPEEVTHQVLDAIGRGTAGEHDG